MSKKKIVDKIKCCRCNNVIKGDELKEVNKQNKEMIQESRKYKLSYDGSLIPYLCGSCADSDFNNTDLKSQLDKHIADNKKIANKKKSRKFKLDKTRCSACGCKLYKEELKTIRDSTEYTEEGDEPWTDEQLEKYYVCDDCIDDAMDCYGDGDDICMSGADDIFVSKRMAYSCFGM